jgi:hydrogenase maturation protease
MSKRILLAGIGNIFCGDDAFGVEVVRTLAQIPMPESVVIKDFGIRSYDLAYAMLDGYDVVILIDAAPRGQPPGTLYVIQPDLEEFAKSDGEIVNAHSMNPVRVLQMVQALGGYSGLLYVVGCEPEILEADDYKLSEQVQAAIPRAVEKILELVHALTEEKTSAATLNVRQ